MKKNINFGLQSPNARVCSKANCNAQRNAPSAVNAINNSESTTYPDKTANAIINNKYNPECKSDYERPDDNIVASIASTSLQIEPRSTTLRISNIDVVSLIRKVCAASTSNSNHRQFFYSAMTNNNTHQRIKKLCQ